MFVRTNCQIKVCRVQKRAVGLGAKHVISDMTSQCHKRRRLALWRESSRGRRVDVVVAIYRSKHAVTMVSSQVDGDLMALMKHPRRKVLPLLKGNTWAEIQIGKPRR
ncbi:hypothetical protein J6590_033539 [Homalodisca vitripennis]|nr:hypothetical protein J6590_033539 [Homalodisca vitripennis]